MKAEKRLRRRLERVSWECERWDDERSSVNPRDRPEKSLHNHYQSDCESFSVSSWASSRRVDKSSTEKSERNDSGRQYLRARWNERGFAERESLHHHIRSKLNLLEKYCVFVESNLFFIKFFFWWSLTRFVWVAQREKFFMFFPWMVEIFSPKKTRAP